MDSKKNWTIGAIIGLCLIAFVKQSDTIFKALISSSDDIVKTTVREAKDLLGQSGGGYLNPALIRGGVRVLNNEGKKQSYSSISDDNLNGLVEVGYIHFNGKISVSDYYSTYVINPDGIYELTKTHSIFQSAFYINDEPQPVEKEVDTELPNKLTGEYDNVVLIISDNKILLENNVKYITESSEIVFSSTGELKLIKGDMIDFKDGKIVIATYTQDSLETIKTQFKNFMIQTLNAEFESEAGTEVLDPKVHFGYFPNSTITITKDSVTEVQNGNIEMTIDFIVEVEIEN